MNINDNQKLPKVLIVSRGVWNENEGTSSTLTSIFSDYNPEMLAHIYTQTRTPHTHCCKNFFQISEISLVKKLFRWNLQTGRVVSKTEGTDLDVTKDASDENRIYKLVRSKRLYIFDFMQDLLWMLNGWKSKELKNFIQTFNPDVVWIDGIVSIYMCRLYLYVLNVANKPGILYMMDDNYTFESLCNKFYIRRLLLRKYTRKIVDKCKTMFVISPKMKNEFDRIFNRNSIIVTKGIDYSKLSFQPYTPHQPIRLLYLGQILYGRIFTLKLLASALDEINKDGIKIILDVYTNTLLQDNEKETMSKNGSVVFHDPVPYSQVPSVMHNSDVLVFLESLERKYLKDARLSFSTKITDYLSSGKCIFAIGPSDSAPIDYFKQEKSALVASTDKEISAVLKQMTESNILSENAQAAFECGYRNHEKNMMRNRVLSEFNKLVLSKNG